MSNPGRYSWFGLCHALSRERRSTTRAAKNVAWVHDTLQKLVDNPRLLENGVFLVGTLKSLIKSLDADNNPAMAVLKIHKDEVRRL